jgi:hypothetical protein
VKKVMAIALGLLFVVSGVLPLQAQESPAQEKKVKGKKARTVKVGARIHSLWTLTSNPGEIEAGVPRAENQFTMEMARLEVQWVPEKWLDAKLQGDFEEIFAEGSAKAMLRDAWMQMSIFPWLKLKAGQSKRPFSRFELRSRGKLETIHRGASNGWIINKLGYGERDLGISLAGRFGKKKEPNISYAVGLYNGSGKNAEDEDAGGAKDFVARVEGAPVPWLSLGLNGSFKFFDPDEFSKRPDFAWMSGADMRLKLGDFRLFVEGLFGENHDQCIYTAAPSVCRLMDAYAGVPYSWSVAAMAAYKISLHGKWKFAVQPMLKGEYFVPDHELEGGEIITASAGVNLFFSKYFRVMVQGELVRAEADKLQENWQSVERFMVQFAFDL